MNKNLKIISRATEETSYKSENGEYIVNPEPSMLIKKNSKLILIGRPNQIESLKELYNV